jgi:hypothetical protein
LLVYGQDREPFLGKTLPPCGKRHGRRETIVRRSQERYSTRRGDIERKIDLWMR